MRCAILEREQAEAVLAAIHRTIPYIILGDLMTMAEIVPIVGQRWRHKKRGTIYTEIARGTLQTNEHPSLDDEAVVIYRADHNGSWWCRPAHEFDDGRFERIDTAPDHPEQHQQYDEAAADFVQRRVEKHTNSGDAS